MFKVKTRIKSGITCFAVIVFVYLVFTILGIGCPIKFITGVPCLGCGMTRALISVLELNLKDALYYHPMVIVLVPVSIFHVSDYFIFHIDKKIWNIIIAIICIMFIVCYIIRISFGYGIFSDWDIKDGLVYRILCALAGGAPHLPF